MIEFYLQIIRIKFMKKILSILVLGLIFIGNSYAWEKVPVPDYIDKKTASPWNFFDNFEDQKVGKVKLNRYHINDKGKGKKPFQIKQDPDGNKFLAITVKHGWNKCCGSWNNTERAEFEVKGKKAREKEIWYGFRIRLPENFVHIDDRLLFNQFKNQFNPMRGSPLIGMKFYSNGNLMKFGGQTGGPSGKGWNEDLNFKYYYQYEYKDRYGFGILNLDKQKNLNEDKFSCTKINKIKTSTGTKTTYPGSCLNGGNKFQKSKLGEWTTYKVGVKNTKKKDGFVKIYRNDKLIVDYKGITFNWKGSYTGSHVRIGPYRDSDPKKKGYPDQTIHYDDFIVVSDKKTLDRFLDKN